MSCHEVLVRADGLKLKPDTTIKMVIQAIDRFLTRHSIEIHPMEDPDALEDVGEVLFDRDGSLELSAERSLSLSLHCTSSGSGIPPDSIDELKTGIAGLILTGGAIVWYDQSTSPANEDGAVGVFFVGSSDREEQLARIRYGLDQAKDWLRPVIGEDRWNAICAIAAGEPPQVFVTVENGEVGICTSVHLTREGAEQCLLELTQEYSVNGAPPLDVPEVRRQLAQMREDEKNNIDSVIQCASLGTLWINQGPLNL